MCVLYLVIPCYNEQEVLPEASKQMLEKMNSLIGNGKISDESKIVLVNDGSKDRTWEIIEELHSENPMFQGVKLSR
ncbi:MAG TPA: glycosyltransferase, partial [Clostridiales bacterium]|nr:glycosyltransferase [Clostridiales bacterium]